MYRPKVYTASKIRHGGLWRSWVHRLPQIEFTARWINLDGSDHNTTHWNPAQKKLHWIEDIQDVQRSDYLICYTLEGDANKGTLVEAGCAIGLGKIVLAVGFDINHSWVSHPLVLECETLEETFDFILGKIEDRELRNYANK